MTVRSIYQWTSHAQTERFGNRYSFGWQTTFRRNRTLFMEKIDEALARLRHGGERFSVFMIDADGEARYLGKAEDVLKPKK